MHNDNKPECRCVEFFSLYSNDDENQMSMKGPFMEQNETTKKAYLKNLSVENNNVFLLPTQRRTGKFIQVTFHEQHYPGGLDILAFMPFSEHNTWYHAAILKELLYRLNIAGGFPDSYKHLNNYEFSEYDREVLTVLGGGYYELDEQTLLLTLSGKSTAYGPYQKKRLQQLFNHNPHCFSDYQLVLF